MLQDQSVTAAELVGDPAPQNGMSAIGSLFTRGPGAEQRRCWPRCSESFQQMVVSSQQEACQ